MTESESRARRSDGARTHEAILRKATELASVEGVTGLTIGRLAASLGVSKSGLYAHFGSKEQLQLETIQAAAEIMMREVMAPAMEAPEGLARLEAACGAYLSYVERRVFPGGCFFAGLIPEMDGRSGPVRESTVAMADEWLGWLRGLAADARDRGELRSDVDVAQLVFELDASMEMANHHSMLGDPAAIERGHRAVRDALDRARAPSPG